MEQSIGENSNNSDNEMGDDNECLDELEDLLVPVTVLSTKEDDNVRNSSGMGDLRRDEKEKSRKGRPPGQRKSVSPSSSTSQSGNNPESSRGHQTESNQERGSQGEEEGEEDEDEFEDEGELQTGSCNSSGNNDNAEASLRIPAECRPLQPVIVPMPVMKRASLSLEEKVAIIRELEGGEKQSWICKKKRLAKSTVQSIWKNKEKILDASEKIGMSRKRCRRAQHENVEDKLMEWIETLKSQNVPVNGPQLRAKAQVFAKQLGIEDFRSSTGWLDKFKTRHNIAFKKSAKGGAGGIVPKNNENSKSTAAADKKFAIDWVTRVWPNLCEGYTPENIFNADEFGLFFHALPDQASKLMHETCHGGRMAHDRVSVLLCVNSDGTEKRKLAVVSCFELGGAVNVKNLPVSYYTNSKSWINNRIFEEELIRWNEELKEANRNILVILDNSPAHQVNEASLTSIKLVYLPPVVASILQPTEHGIVQQVKLYYRRLMLDKIVRRAQGSSRSDHLHGNFGSSRRGSSSADTVDINIMDAIVLLNCAWTSVPTDDINECFKTSNLQSINVSSIRSTQTSTALDRAEKLSRVDAELMEKVAAFVPHLHLPNNFTLHSYSEVDNRLHVTDYINEETPNSNSSTNPIMINVPPPEVSSKVQIQQFLTLIRNWVMALPSDIGDCSNSIHESISILENFAMQQEGQPSLISSHHHHSHHLPHHQLQLSASQQSNNNSSNNSMIHANSGSSLVPPSRHHPSSHNNNNNRVMLNAPVNNNDAGGMNLTPSQQHGSVLPMSSVPHHGHNSNANSTNATTVVTFTLADSLQQSNLPHHLLDQQQFFYLT